MSGIIREKKKGNLEKQTDGRDRGKVKREDSVLSIMLSYREFLKGCRQWCEENIKFCLCLHINVYKLPNIYSSVTLLFMHLKIIRNVCKGVCTKNSFSLSFIMKNRSN